MHAIQRRYYVEDLLRKRRADEHQRSGAVRRGRIDPNPHQIDAVMFALGRLPEGGCILADEVGLGKTIEAGLVIAQRLAEGVKRVLLIVPTSLVPQWQTELDELFLIETRDGTSEPLGEEGTFLVSRDWAGGEQGAAQLREAEPFELCIIDEAHEIFAGIHKRFDKEGRYMPVAKGAVMAHRVREAIRPPTPILLLTATPIQNSLAELWGLVQYVEPTGTLLGNLSTFRQVFCDGDDRLLRSEQASELRDRLERVVKRTLRRDAQPFLEHPFVDRRARLYEYEMTEEERELYDDVTAYLLEPDLCAFPSSSRRLLLIGFHRRMASSSRALASSLRKVAARLERYLEAAQGQAELEEDDFVREEFADLEDEGLELLKPPNKAAGPEEPPASRRVVHSVERIQAELERVRTFSERAERLPHDSKAAALLQAVKTIEELAARNGTSGKVVVFTESRVTQQYLRELLMKRGNVADEDITLFSSTNDSPRALQALERWRAEVGQFRSCSIKRQTAVRAALVYEFRERSRVFISTEAGAKGLNLQFCETLINYDMPWNPQRIEQRIGRCHRYGQRHEVMVINFISKDNEAQRLTFDILSRKLDLFGTVLDASDEVLHEADSAAPETLAGALGAGFEKSLSEIYERARTRDELAQEIRRLRDDTDTAKKRFSEELERTAGVIETQLHENVRERFRSIQAALPGELAQLDAYMEQVVTAYLDAQGVSYEITGEPRLVSGGAMAAAQVTSSAAPATADWRVLSVAASEKLPEPLRAGAQMSLRGARRDDKVEALHPAHPLLQAAAAEARAATESRRTVSISVGGTRLAEYIGQRGVLLVERVRYQSFEDFERLLTVAVLENERLLVGEEASGLFECPVQDRAGFDAALEVSDELVEDAFEEALFLEQETVGQRTQEQFEKALVQLERYVLDQMLLLKRRRGSLVERIARGEEARDAAVGSHARTKAEESLKALEAELETVEGEYERLSERKDERFERWSTRAHERRYAEPKRERLFTVEFELT